MKSIILVTAHGYTDSNIANVFVNSLKASGYTGTIGLITENLKINYPNVIYIPWENDDTYFRSSKRLFHYLKFLNGSDVIYNQVITAGIRDVLFQSNPQEMPYDDVNIYREPDGPTIGTCPYNSRWVTNSGYSSLHLMSKPIICAEIMVGNHAGMVRLLKQMCDTAERNPRKYDLEDQAILNYLYWNQKLPYVKCWENEYSPVYTVGYEPFIRFRNGQIVNRALDVPAIVHQYDRHVSLG